MLTIDMRVRFKKVRARTGGVLDMKKIPDGVVKKYHRNGKVKLDAV